MKKTFMILFISIFSISTFSQEFLVPVNFEPKLKEDYAPAEPQILEAIKWSLNTPLDEHTEKRKEVYAFFMKWMTGTPDLKIALDAEDIRFTKKNPDLLLPFIMGWVKYSLENNHSKDDLRGNEAGIRTIVKFYEDNKRNLKRDKEIESFSNLINKGQLAEELQKRFK